LYFYDDKSDDGTGAALREECARRLSRYNWQVISSSEREGPAIARARLLNEVRSKPGEKLVVMLDLDDTVSHYFGRYLAKVIEKGFCNEFYTGNFFFHGKPKRAWPPIHGMSGERIYALAQMPFSWHHIRMWWENVEECIDLEKLRFGTEGIFYCSDVAFFIALSSQLPKETVIRRTYDYLYKYVHDGVGGTIKKYGPLKKVTACYLLTNR
jgi:glycosyltransferase involved in cell wall biosynthesis